MKHLATLLLLASVAVAEEEKTPATCWAAFAGAVAAKDPAKVWACFSAASRKEYLESDGLKALIALQEAPEERLEKVAERFGVSVDEVQRASPERLAQLMLFQVIGSTWIAEKTTLVVESTKPATDKQPLAIAECLVRQGDELVNALAFVEEKDGWKIDLGASRVYQERKQKELAGPDKK